MEKEQIISDEVIISKERYLKDVNEIENRHNKEIQELKSALDLWEATIKAQPKDVQDKIKQVRKEMTEVRRK